MSVVVVEVVVVVVVVGAYGQLTWLDGRHCFSVGLKYWPDGHLFLFYRL